MEELPIARIPDTPHWSENFAFACFDPRAGLGLFCHIGRWRRDLTLWREVVAVALPDHTILVHRGIGNALATARGPGGSNFSVEVVEPGPRFHLRFLGGVRRVDEKVLFEGPLLEGPYYRLEFDVTFEGVAPIWDISSVGHKTEFMGAGHIEQFGRFRGPLMIGAERHELDTIGNRDHSRGPRVLDSNIRHSWLHGILDDGTMFQLYEAEIAGREGPAYAEANVVAGGVPYKAKATILEKLPFSENRHLIRDTVRLTIEYDNKILNLSVSDYPSTISIQSTSPNDMYLGRRQEDPIQNTTVAEQSVLYRTSDGRSGYGHMERLVPGKLLVDPA